MRNAAFWLFAALFLSGCASEYSWRSKVPDDMRTVSVPVFRNESEVTELGAVAARQLLREVQREGTFRIASPGNGAISFRAAFHRTSSSARRPMLPSICS